MTRFLWAMLFSLLLVAPANAGFSIGGWPAMTYKDEADPVKTMRFGELKRAFIRDYQRSIPDTVTPEIVRRRKEIYDLALEVVEPGFALASQMDGYGLVLVAGGRVTEAQPIFAGALAMRLEEAADARWKSKAYEAFASVKLRSPGHEVEALAPAELAIDYWRQSQDDGDDAWGVSEKELYAEWDSDGVFATYTSALWASSQGSGGVAPATQRKALEAAQRALINRPESLALSRLTARELATRRGGELPALLAQRDASFVEREAESRKYTAAARARRSAQTDRSPFSGSAELPSPEQVEAEAAAERISERIRNLTTRIDSGWPEYRRTAFPAPMPLDAVQKMLREDEAAIVIATSTYRTQVFAIDRMRIEWRQVPTGFFDLVEAVRRLRWFAGAHVETTEEQELAWLAAVDGGINGFDRDTAHQLYRQIFKPVEMIFKGKRVVYVAADDPLDALPLAMLVSAPPEGHDDDPTALRETNWFGDDIAIAMLPSLQALASIRERPASRAPRQFAGFGDPLLNGNGASRGDRGAREDEPAPSALDEESLSEGDAGGFVSPKRLLRMARLPGTAQEIRSIALAFGPGESDIFLNSRATEMQVRSVDLSQYRVIDFATHGVLAGALGKDVETGLVFTPPQAPTGADDGFLTASEVRRLELDADWVILSACNTAGGDDYESTGASGLAHGFFTAGARSLLLSHWPVRDDVAPVLVSNAVGGPRHSGGTRAEAVQRAMKIVRNNSSHDGIRRDGIDQTWAHPNAWAAFALVGEGL